MSRYQGTHSVRHSVYARHEVKSRPSWGFMLVLFILLVIALTYFFPSVIKVHALENVTPTGYLSWNNPMGQAESTGKHIAYVYTTRHGNTGMLVYTPLPEIDYPVNVGVVVVKQQRKERDEDTTVMPAVVTQEPVNEPVVNPPADEPTDEPVIDEPEDNDDKGKCNSGRGNGSEDTDGDGQDDDPGNSEGHNRGGD